MNLSLMLICIQLKSKCLHFQCFYVQIACLFLLNKIHLFCNSMKQVDNLQRSLHFIFLFLDQFSKMVDTDIVKTFIKLDGEKEDVEETGVAKKKVANVVSGSRTAVIDQVHTHQAGFFTTTTLETPKLLQLEVVIIRGHVTKALRCRPKMRSCNFLRPLNCCRHKTLTPPPYFS